MNTDTILTSLDTWITEALRSGLFDKDYIIAMVEQADESIHERDQEEEPCPEQSTSLEP
jgi:hypothetical protein